ncbi:MAG: signal peptidase II [Betaproteobacteria bacterium]|nr:signal peptidase II [Betaproteobacteria bacterium]
MRRFAGWVVLALGVVGLDQIAKHAVVSALGGGGSIYVAPFFSIILTYNTGAAFSLLADASGWQRAFFTVIAIAASAVIVYVLWRNARNAFLSLALSLILGGALGNLVDRITLGHVVDFLYFHYRGFSFPAFNVADSSITCGAFLIAWDGLLRRSRPQGQGW